MKNGVFKRQFVFQATTRVKHASAHSGVICNIVIINLSLLRTLPMHLIQTAESAYLTLNWEKRVKNKHEFQEAKDNLRDE